jgi:hypothetical protein
LAVDTFGQHGTNELIYLVGLYGLVSTTLNGFNVPVPEREPRSMACKRPLGHNIFGRHNLHIELFQIGHGILFFDL